MFCTNLCQFERKNSLVFIIHQPISITNVSFDHCIGCGLAHTDAYSVVHKTLKKKKYIYIYFFFFFFLMNRKMRSNAEGNGL